MTVLKERKRDAAIYAWFLIVILAIAAWRGASGAPVVAAILGVLAVVAFVAWLAWRRRPPSELRISDSEITWGSPTKVVTRVSRDGTGELEFHRNAAQQTAWFLRQADEPDAGGVSMIGFDLHEVGRVCADHGWTVT